MKKSKLALCYLLFAGSLTVSAQDYAFKVLANKGSNEHKSGDAWQPLKTGASLNANDEIKISDNAYIGMVHITGKPLEIKQPGTYTVMALAEKIKQGSTVLSKYTDFILSSNSAEAKKNRLSATGAVHRGESSEAIELLLPGNQDAQIFNNTATVIWESPDVEGPYIVTLKNMFEDKILTFETAEPHYTVDLSSPALARENAILVEVKSKADAKKASSQYMIKRLAPADASKVGELLNEISAEVKESTALNQMILAAFFEKNKLYIDAISAYSKAISLAPEVPEFKTAFEEFLLRQGIK